MISTPVSLFGGDDRFAAASAVPHTAATAVSTAATHDVELREDGLQVATRLMAALGPEDRILAVTACEEEDGAGELAAQLAMGLSRIGQEPVALVDANIRQPSLSGLFGAEGNQGLSDIAAKGLDLSSALRRYAGGFAFLPAGSESATLPAPACARAVAALRSQFRYTVIATAPLLRHAEAVTLGSVSDGVVLALRAGKRKRDEVLDVQRELGRLKVRFLGAVLRA